ncbi:MAG: S9 family peptidase [Actinomycetota bacterium]|nr:S9 family peptidase [Actinomycetota bacterium]
MDRDLRETPLYKDIEEHYRKLLEPAFGRISGAAGLAPSPDGRRIAFTGSKLSKLEGVPGTRVCVVDLETHELDEVTAGPGNDARPQWSPDGTRLAFLSDRQQRGRNRLYLLDAGRVGEARPGPDVDGTIEYAAWSPDSAWILLGVAPMEADKAGAEGSGTKDSEADAPSWLPEVERSDGAGEWRRLFLYELATGNVRQVSREGLTVWEAAWCGPARIAAVVSEAPGEDAWYESVLALIDAGTGEDRVLYRTGTILRQVGVPSANPSGSRLAVLQALCSDRGIVAGDLLLIDPDSGHASPVEAHGVDVSHVAWRDDDHLLWIGVRGLDTVAGEQDASTGSSVELWASEETSGYWHPDAAPLADGSFALVLESHERPPEIAVVRDGKADTVVSFAHDGTRYAQEVGGRLERVNWKARDGIDLEGFVLLPPGAGPHPLVVNVHGGPIASYRNRWVAGWTPHVLVSRGYAVFLPNPRGSTGRGQEFAEHVVGDMGGKDADDVLSGIDALVERGIAAPDRLGVMGGSYGGFMTAWLVTQTDRFAAAVSISPVTDWYSQHFNSNIGPWDSAFLDGDPASPGGPYFERSPVFLAAKARTPVLVTAGVRDRCTPPGQAVEFYRALRANGVETEVVLYPEEGHGVRQMPALFDFVTRTVAWFERHMPASGGEATP